MAATAKKLPIALEDIAATTLRGDLRDFLMQWGQNLQKPWPQMSQREQEAFRDACDRQAETIVRRTTQLVGSQGFESFEISVGDFQKKGTRLEAKIGAPYSRETLIDLAEAGEAGPIVLSLVSLKTFQGERAPAKVMPDQPDLMDDVDQQPGAPGYAEERAADAGGETTDAPDGGTTLGAGAGDTLAAGQQAEALAAATGTGTGDQALTDAEREALGPEARANVDALAGIGTLDTAGAEPIDATSGDAPKKRRRRTAEERTADNAAAAEAGRPQSEQRAG